LVLAEVFKRIPEARLPAVTPATIQSSALLRLLAAVAAAEIIMLPPLMGLPGAAVGLGAPIPGLVQPGRDTMVATAVTLVASPIMEVEAAVQGLLAQTLLPASEGVMAAMEFCLPLLALIFTVQAAVAVALFLTPAVLVALAVAVQAVVEMERLEQLTPEAEGEQGAEAVLALRAAPAS
jgi:hypothetical protein